MNNLNKKLGQLVKDQRIKKQMTQADLAQRLGYGTTQFVSLFERGRSKIPLNILGQLIIILNLSEKRIVQMLIDQYKLEVLFQLQKGKKQAKP